MTPPLPPPAIASVDVHQNPPTVAPTCPWPAGTPGDGEVAHKELWPRALAERPHWARNLTVQAWGGYGAESAQQRKGLLLPEEWSGGESQKGSNLHLVTGVKGDHTVPSRVAGWWLPWKSPQNLSVGEVPLCARRVLWLPHPLEAWSKEGKGHSHRRRYKCSKSEWYKC